MIDWANISAISTSMNRGEVDKSDGGKDDRRQEFWECIHGNLCKRH